MNPTTPQVGQWFYFPVAVKYGLAVEHGRIVKVSHGLLDVELLTVGDVVHSLSVAMIFATHAEAQAAINAHLHA
jgi:hypothetical protein